MTVVGVVRPEEQEVVGVVKAEEQDDRNKTQYISIIQQLLLPSFIPST